MSSYKLPKGFQQIVVINSLKWEMLVGHPEMNSKISAKFMKVKN